MVYALVIIINIPTDLRIVFGCKNFKINAPIGAAITPPKINAKTGFQESMPKKYIKIPVLVNVTKNSAVFTVPITSLGEFPLSIKFEDTIGPQPPPPMVSKNAPIKPKIGAKRQLLCFAVKFLKLLIRINIPSISKYAATYGFTVLPSNTFEIR